MGWSQLGVLVLGLCCAAPVVWGQGYVNIAPGKTYNQSSTYDSRYLASYAADGNTATDPYFRSNYGYGHFWEVDLGRKYPVQNINVWGRASINDYLTPFNITVDGQHCETVNSTQTSRNISVTCSSLLYGQRIRLSRIDTSRSYLILCEFEILACTPGLYGDNCTQTCRPSKCLDNTCHPDTGLCIECGGNFNGSTCSECKAGYHRSGDSCYPCSSLCAGSQCDPSNGSCIGCVDGRHGATCNTTCSPAGCQTCHQHSGNCTACKPLYNLDPTSQCKACKDGFSKHNSSICSPCSTSCKDRKCNGDTGDCTQGCVDGRHGATCTTTCSPAGCQTCHQHSGNCTACKPFYNLDPTSQCKECVEGFSKHNTATCSPCSAFCNTGGCDTITGNCTNGCRPGFHGYECEKSCSTITSQCVQCTQSGQCTACSGHFQPPDCTAQGETTKQQAVYESDTDKLIVPVAGSIVGVGLLLTISLTAAVCWINRRREHSKFTDKEDNYYSTPDPVLMLSNTERGLPELPSSSPSSGNSEHTEPKTMQTDITDDDYTHPKTIHTGNTGNEYTQPKTIHTGNTGNTGNEYTHPKTIHTGNTGNDYTHPKTIHTGNTGNDYTHLKTIHTGNDYTHLKTIHTGNTDGDYTRPLAVQTINTDEKNTQINTVRTESPDRQGTQPKMSCTHDAGKQGTEDTDEDHIYSSMDTEETTF